VAGTGTAGFSGDGGPATAAQLNGPIGLAVDSEDSLYIADQSNFRIRKVTAAGVISTVAGTGTAGFSGDGGPATVAQLNLPTGVAVDSAGDLYIADPGNFTVRKVSLASSSGTFFPQVAVGGGYSTSFAVTNTGATVSAGNLTLTDQQGNPLTVSGELTDSSGTTQSAITGSAFTFIVPAGGTIFLSASGPAPTSPAKSGWARLTSSGGSLNAVARFEFAVGGFLMTAVEVPQSQPLQDATVQKGTVAMLLLQRLPHCRVIGIEALEVSHDLAVRNALLNCIADRWEPQLGDLRDPSVLAGEPPFELVTGAPPFMAVGSGIMPADSQRAAGRFELRGGVRDYAEAAARNLAPGGRVVILMDGLDRSRTVTAGALAAVGLHVRAVATVLPCPGRDPVYRIFEASALSGPTVEVSLCMRLEGGGAFSPEYETIRREMDCAPGLARR